MQGTESGASERALASCDSPASARGLLALVDRIPLALAVLVLIAALLRIALELSYRPLVLSFPDSGAYMQMAHDSTFDDPGRMVGYPVFLEIVHWLSANVERTIEIQHILGLVTGVLLYATVRRLGAPIWVALIGAAAVLSRSTRSSSSTCSRPRRRSPASTRVRSTARSADSIRAASSPARSAHGSSGSSAPGSCSEPQSGYGAWRSS